MLSSSPLRRRLEVARVHAIPQFGSVHFKRRTIAPVTSRRACNTVPSSKPGHGCAARPTLDLPEKSNIHSIREDQKGLCFLFTVCLTYEVQPTEYYRNSRRRGLRISRRCPRPMTTVMLMLLYSRLHASRSCTMIQQKNADYSVSRLQQGDSESSLRPLICGRKMRPPTTACWNRPKFLRMFSSRSSSVLASKVEMWPRSGHCDRALQFGQAKYPRQHKSSQCLFDAPRASRQMPYAR